jgi:uncharacterized protein YbbK (DUF523 family)
MKIKLGISSCLLGINVRYDGGDKLDRFLRDTLGACVEYVPVCPEVECGLSVPREPMHLTGNPANPRLIITNSKLDRTDLLQIWARKRVVNLESENLCGFIFKTDSPSCGMEGVRIHNEKRLAVKTGAGIFARILMEHFPLLPVIDEVLIRNSVLWNSFLESIFMASKVNYDFLINVTENSS